MLPVGTWQEPDQKEAGASRRKAGGVGLVCGLWTVRSRGQGPRAQGYRSGGGGQTLRPFSLPSPAQPPGQEDEAASEKHTSGAPNPASAPC